METIDLTQNDVNADKPPPHMTSKISTNRKKKRTVDDLTTEVKKLITRPLAQPLSTLEQKTSKKSKKSKRNTKEEFDSDENVLIEVKKCYLCDKESCLGVLCQEKCKDTFICCVCDLRRHYAPVQVKHHQMSSRDQYGLQIEWDLKQQCPVCKKGSPFQTKWLHLAAFDKETRQTTVAINNLRCPFCHVTANVLVKAKNNFQTKFGNHVKNCNQKHINCNLCMMPITNFQTKSVWKEHYHTSCRGALICIYCKRAVYPQELVRFHSSSSACQHDLLVTFYDLWCGPLASRKICCEKADYRIGRLDNQDQRDLRKFKSVFELAIQSLNHNWSAPALLDKKQETELVVVDDDTQLIVGDTDQEQLTRIDREREKQRRQEVQLGEEEPTVPDEDLWLSTVE